MKWPRSACRMRENSVCDEINKNSCKIDRTSIENLWFQRKVDGFNEKLIIFFVRAVASTRSKSCFFFWFRDLYELGKKPDNIHFFKIMKRARYVCTTKYPKCRRIWKQRVSVDWKKRIDYFANGWKRGKKQEKYVPKTLNRIDSEFVEFCWIPNTSAPTKQINRFRNCLLAGAQNQLSCSCWIKRIRLAEKNRCSEWPLGWHRIFRWLLFGTTLLRSSRSTSW